VRILLSSEHRYPALNGVSFGPHPKEFPSGSGHHLHDLLAKGLAEAGHEVLYCLSRAPERPLPPGVTWITEPDSSFDIFHHVGVSCEDVIEFVRSHGKPWVTTCHVDRRSQRAPGWQPGSNWIFVSKMLAASHNSDRYIHNGLDPSNYVYSAAKQDYFLFMSAVERALQKGLETAFEISRRTGIRLVVAGTGQAYPAIREMERACQENGAEYVGDVQGAEKAEVFAGAKAFLFPTRLNEAFGLVMVEALLSGTPVIASGKGACPEVIDPSVGFICQDLDDYLAAVDRLGEIRPETCRSYAMERFHYQRMTADYVREYESEIAACGAGGDVSASISLAACHGANRV
jgi:glycosyltransferase involved in cell wall biosynthesis